MAQNPFPHSIPNNTGDKIRKEEPDLSYDVPGLCGIATVNGDVNIVACGGYSGKLDATGNITSLSNINGVVITASGGFVGNLTGNVTGTASGNKLLPFDIPHVKQKGKRIRHIIAEGPEAGIYIRGKLTGSNVIDLPEYWDGLVDPDSITVTLTQIGHSQDLIIKEIEGDKKIIIKSGNGTDINCFYEVWAARWINPMDHDEKLFVVYDGETPDDYPGNNGNFLIGGWDYDRRNPQWESPEKKTVKKPSTKS